MSSRILWKSIIIYIITTVAFCSTISWLLPVLKQYGFTQIEAYLFSAGIVLFCLLFLAILLTKTELKNYFSQNVFKRLRLNKLTRKDFTVILIGILAILLLDGVIFGFNAIFKTITGIDLEMSKLPDFTGINILIKGDYHIIVVYFIYLCFNIFGEELLWRGYLLPLQENYF